jgi:Flp pilus assembly pilin Flp
MIAFLKSFLAETKGASAVEYGLIAASVAVAMIVAVSTFSESPSVSSYISVAEADVP